MIELSLLKSLNEGSKDERFSALTRAVARASFPPVDPRMVNNHVHTTYSFSPYSPAAAVYAARAEGLATCGIVDHDSMGGAREFIEAGRIVGIPTTIGSRRGCRFARPRLPTGGRITGSDWQQLYGAARRAAREYRESAGVFCAAARTQKRRNRAMLARSTRLRGRRRFARFGAGCAAASQFADGGSVTERHLMLALARQLLALGKAKLPEYATELEVLLAEYDLVGALKKECIPRCLSRDGRVSEFERVCALCSKRKRHSGVRLSRRRNQQRDRR